MAARSNIADLHGYGDLYPDVAVFGGHANANGRQVYGRPRRGCTWLERAGTRAEAPRASLNSWLLAGASVLLAALAAAMFAVSWHGQYGAVYAERHQHLASGLEALGMDTALVCFALLGIVLARLGRRAVIERVLVVICGSGSVGMNLLAADLGSPRSVAIYAMPPVLFILVSDRVTAVIRRAALGPDWDRDAQRSAWHVAGMAALYGLRLVVAPPSTAKGARQALLNATPLPGLPTAQRKAIDPPRRPGPQKPRRRQPGPTKTQRFLDLVAERHGPLSDFPVADVSKVATALGPEVGLHPGSARTALKAAVTVAQDGGRP